eukprot:s317_g37.t1
MRPRGFDGHLARWTREPSGRKASAGHHSVVSRGISAVDTGAVGRPGLELKARQAFVLSWVVEFIHCFLGEITVGREALGLLAEDGLAMYLGAWEYDADDWTRGGADWSDGLNSELGSVPFARCIFKDELGERHELCRSLRWIYIGEEGSGTSAHRDPLCSHGWMWLARGQKQWHLVTWEEAVAGCEAVPQGAPKDLFSVKGCEELDAWLKRLNARHEAWCGNLCEGELIFIPSGILHAVKNVGKGISIAVSHNFLDETCMTSVLGCLRQALQMLLDDMSSRSLSCDPCHVLELRGFFSQQLVLGHPRGDSAPTAMAQSPTALSPTALITDKTIKPIDMVQSPRSHVEPTGFMRPNRVSEEHEALMQEFVHAHLMTILQPFSEQLQTLQDKLQQVSAQIPPVSKEVVQHREQLAMLQSSIPPLEQRDNELAKLIESAVGEVRRLVPKHEALAQDHDYLKSCLAEADGRLRGAAEQIEELMSGQDGVLTRLERFQEGLSEVEKHVSTVVESRLNYLHTFCKDLRTEQTTQLETMSHFQDSFNKQADGLKQLRLRVSTLQAEDEEKFACLNQHAKGLEAKISQYVPEIRTAEEGVKIQEKELQRVFQEISKLRSMQQLYAEYSEIFISVKENTRRVAKLEDTMQVVSARNPVEQHHFQETIQRIQNQVDDNETRLQSVDRNQIAISGRIEQVAHSPLAVPMLLFLPNCGVGPSTTALLEAMWRCSLGIVA